MHFSAWELVAIIASGVVVGLLAWRLLPWAVALAVVAVPVLFVWDKPIRLDYVAGALVVYGSVAALAVLLAKWLEPWRVNRLRRRLQDPHREAAFEALVGQYVAELSRGSTPKVKGYYNERALEEARTVHLKEARKSHQPSHTRKLIGRLRG